MSKRFSRKSTEDRRAEMDGLHDRLTVEVEQLRSSDGWRRYLAFARAFRNYSVRNQLLIMSQMPTATRVAGFRTWQKLGRQVRKGERGIRILAGRPFTRETDDGEEIQAVAFAPTSVFDISQTDPIPGADPAPEFEEFYQLLAGADDADILDLAEQYLTADGWTMTREHLGVDGLNGVTSFQPRTVKIEAALSDAQAASTALHEIAHVVMHADTDRRELHRGRREVEAESVAHLVAASFGLDTASKSFAYVAHWAESAEADVLCETAGAVVQTAADIAAELHTIATTHEPLRV